MKHRIFAATLTIFAAFVLAPGVAGAQVDAQKMWSAQCKKCHGVAGKGDTKVGRKMKVGSMATEAWHKKFDDKAITKAITKGLERVKDGKKQKMKAYTDLKPEELEALLKFIRTFTPKPG